MTGDLRLEWIAIDPDAVDPEDVEMLQDMVVAAVNEVLRSAEELAGAKLGAAGGARLRPDERARRARPRRDGRALGGGGRRRPARRRAQPRRAPAQEALQLLAPPLQRLVTELGKLPGIGNRTAQRLAFHVLRASPEDASALATRSATSRRRSRSARSASTSPRARAARSASTSAATPG